MPERHNSCEGLENKGFSYYNYIIKHGEYKMAAQDLHTWLKDWFKAYHLHMMPETTRLRWEKLRGKDDESDVITAETQQHYRDFIAGVGDEVKIKVDKKNKDEVNRIFGGSWSEGNEITVRITSPEVQREYFEKINVSTKIGDKVYLGDLRSGAQKSWGDSKTGKLLDKVPVITNIDPDTGAPREDINVDSTLSLDEQRRFYAITRDTLRRIKDNPPEFKNPDIPPMVANFLGKGKAFDVPEVSNDVKKPLKQLGELLDDKKSSNFRVWLTSAQPGTGHKIFSEKPTIGEFIEALKTGNYDSSKGIPTKISDFLTMIGEWLNPQYGNSQIERFGHIAKDFQNLFGERGEQASELITLMDPGNEPIDDKKLAMFIHGGVYSNILKALYDPSKPDRQSAFFKDFKNAGGVEVTTPMELVVDNFKYDNMTSKFDDEKTWWQAKDKVIGEWFDDHINKLWKRNLRHHYIEPVAKGVVDAICKSEIEPTSGLKAILEKQEAIKKKIPESGLKGFGFLVEILGKINDSGDMKSAFAGALKNGKQCEAIAAEIIRYGVSQNRVGDAKIALETLAVMRYDTFSSDRWSEWKKNTPDLFKGVKGFDKGFLKGLGSVVNWTVDTGVNLLFWGAVIARNKFQFGRGKMSESRIQEIQDSMEKIRENSLDTSFDTLESTEELVAETSSKLAAYTQELKDFDEKAENKLALEEKKRIEEDEIKINELKDEVKTNHKLRGIKKQFIAEVQARIDGIPLKLSPENHEIYTYWLQENPQGKNEPDVIYKNYLDYLNTEMKTMTNEELRLKIGTIKNKKGRLASQMNRLETLNDTANQRKMLEYKVTVASALNTNAKERFDFQKKRKGERLEKDIPGAPAKDPTTELQDVMELSMFWNAVNGYIPDINVNDTSLEKHKNISKKPDFMKYAQRQHGARAA
jgi:hypothetical protein